MTTITQEQKIIAMNWYYSLGLSKSTSFLKKNFPGRVFGSITDMEIAEVYYKLKYINYENNTIKSRR